MKILVDVNHPAHVHVLRPAVEAWRERGDLCHITARDKDVVFRLLTAYDLPWQRLGRARGGLFGAVLELLSRELQFLRVARAFRPDVAVGTSAHVARVGRIVGAASVFMTEDDTPAVPLSRWVCFPFASAIVTPACLAYEAHGRNHLTYPANQELFYLHPNRFRPDAERLARLGLALEPPYAIIRLSALHAYHDVGKRGIGEMLLRQLLALTAGRVRLLISSEKSLAPEFERHQLDIPPETMHDALAYARFFLGDSQTMTAEAAVLGVPAFRLSDFVGRLSYLEELQRYGLAFGFRPGQEGALLRAIQEVLDQPEAAGVFQARRRRLLSDMIDPLPWFLKAVDGVVGDARLGRSGAERSS
jgi:predicted glycosyltransferase